MFYAVLALLASRKSETSKHTGALSRFDLFFVKPALLPRELSLWLHDAFTQRNSADYAAEFTMNRDGVELVVSRARLFVATVETYLVSNPPVEGDHGGS